MAFVVRLTEKNAFWSGDEEAVWTDEFEKAKKYEDEEAANEALESEIPDYYPLSVVSEDAAFLPEEAPAEEPAAE